MDNFTISERNNIWRPVISSLPLARLGSSSLTLLWLDYRTFKMSNLLSLSASNPQGTKDCYSDQRHSAVLETPHACKHNYLPAGIFGIALWILKL